MNLTVVKILICISLQDIKIMKAFCEKNLRYGRLISRYEQDSCNVLLNHVGSTFVSYLFLTIFFFFLFFFFHFSRTEG